MSKKAHPRFHVSERDFFESFDGPEYQNPNKKKQKKAIVIGAGQMTLDEALTVAMSGNRKASYHDVLEFIQKQPISSEDDAAIEFLKNLNSDRKAMSDMIAAADEFANTFDEMYKAEPNG